MNGYLTALATLATIAMLAVAGLQIKHENERTPPSTSVTTTTVKPAN